MQWKINQRFESQSNVYSYTQYFKIHRQQVWIRAVSQSYFIDGGAPSEILGGAKTNIID